MANEQYDNGKGIEYNSSRPMEDTHIITPVAFREFESKENLREAVRKAVAERRKIEAEKANQPTPEWADLMESLKDAGLEPNLG